MSLETDRKENVRIKILCAVLKVRTTQRFRITDWKIMLNSVSGCDIISVVHFSSIAQW